MLAEGIKGGFAMLYDTLCQLETLGVCRRGYFIEGMGGAQFALPGAVERLRAVRTDAPDGGGGAARTLVLAAADPAQPFGAALAWPKREGQDRRPARVAGAYVVIVADEPALYVERGGRGLLTLTDEPPSVALRALAEAVRRDASQSSRSSASTASPRSPLSWPPRCASSASTPARAG